MVGASGRAEALAARGASTGAATATGANWPVHSDWAASVADNSCPRGLPGPVLAGPESFQLGQHLVQTQARDELHDVVVQSHFLADAEDGHDVGMVQVGRGGASRWKRRSFCGSSKVRVPRTFNATQRPSDSCSAW